MKTWADRAWRLQTWSIGNLMRFNTKRLSALNKAHGIPEFTKENWEKLTAGIKTRARARREQERLRSKDTQRIDPLTGEYLEDWELPLGANAQYQIMGENRPRRFLPPNSADFDKFQILEQPEGEIAEQEKYRTQRTIDKLLRAGWVEVVPTKKDYADFLYDKWLDSLPPSALSQLWADTQKNLREGRPAPDKLIVEFIKMLIELFLVLIWMIHRMSWRNAVIQCRLLTDNLARYNPIGKFEEAVHGGFTLWYSRGCPRDPRADHSNISLFTDEELNT